VADRLLLESGAPDGYLLEDGTGVLLIDAWARNAYEEALAADNPVFVASMEEASGNLTDLIAGKVGTVTGSPTYGAAAFVTGKTSIDFSNVADYFTFSDHADLDLGDTGFTIEFWYARDDDTGGNQVIINKQTNAYAVNIVSTDKFQFGKAGVAGIVRTVETIPSDGSQHHYAITRSAASLAGHAIYIDGVSVSIEASDSPTASLADNALALEIGREAGQQSAGGKLAYVAFYKTALSAARILAHYNAAASGGSVTPDALGLTLTAVAPTFDQTVEPPAIALTLAIAGPDVAQAVLPAALALVLGLVDPRVDLETTPGALALALSLSEPALGSVLAPDALALTLGQASLEARLELAPDALALTLAQPALSITLPSDVLPDAIPLTLTPVAPALGSVLAPDALPLTLGQASFGAGLELAPDALALTLAPVAPRVDLGLAPDAVPLTLGQASFDAGLGLAPDALALTLTPVAPTLPSEVLPDALGLTVALSEPTLGLGLAPDALALTIGQANPTTETSVTPAAVGLTFDQSAPAVSQTTQVEPLPLPLTLTPVGPVASVGASPAAGRPVIEYAIEILTSGATFGPSVSLGEIWDARNLGWSRYDRMPGKAFFTISQGSPFASLITPLTTHVRFYRITPTLTTLVYTGIIVDTDNAGDDIVVTCFDYGALLSISRTGYKVLYPTKMIGTEIVSPEWGLAKGATSSPLAFVATGTIENPTGTDGVTAIKTNNQFGLIDQMRLQLLYDLSEMGRANTAFHTTYEITRSTSPTFNFLKNKGSSVGLGLVLGGNVTDYRHLPNWTSYRNDMATIGQTVGGGATEVIVKDDAAAAARGRRQDVFTIKTLLGIVGAATTADQQRAAAERVLKTALGLQPTLSLRMIRDGIDFFNGWDISDKARVEIKNGADNIASEWRILGCRVTLDETGEYPSIIVSPVAT